MASQASHRRLRHIRLATPQIVTVLLVLVVAITLAAPIVWSRMLEYRLVSTVAPPLEREFGFRAVYEPVGAEGGRVFRLVEVSPDGRLWRAGARVGDRPAPGTCSYAGDYVAAEYFLEGLARAKGGPVQLTMARPRASGHSLETIRIGPESGQP